MLAFATLKRQISMDNYEDLINKLTKITSLMQDTRHFYGCKRYGEAAYVVGHLELGVSRIRNMHQEIQFRTFATPDLIVQWAKGMHDPHHGQWGQSAWQSYEYIDYAGDLYELDNALLYIALATD